MDLYKSFFSLCLGLILSFSVSAHELRGDNPPPSWAGQVSLDSVGLAYYTQNHDYVFGADMGPYQWYNKDGDKYDAWDWSIFARKNFHYIYTLDVGVGISYASALGSEESTGNKIHYWHQVSPYLFLEWVATKNIEIAGGLNLFSYTDKKIADEVTRSWQILDGVQVQLSYFFV